MDIDWITVSAQVVNFLVLVGLLRHFLYRPVMRAMDRREQHIAKRLRDAQEREQYAGEQAAHYQEKQKEIDRRREEILAEVKEEAGRHKKQMVDEIRADVDQVRTNWQRQVQKEKREFLNNLRRESAGAIQAAMRKALRDLADAELEGRIIHAFVERMKRLDAETRRKLKHASESVRVASAFELDSTARGRLTRAIHETIGEGANVEYEEKPELICGIELSAGGQRISWCLNGYLDDLGARVREIFAHAEPAEEGH